MGTNVKAVERRFAALWSAVGCSNLADGMLQVALPAVLVVGGHPAWSVPAVLGASRLPWVFLALHVGLLVDRVSRRALLLTSYVLRSIAAFVIVAGVLLEGPLVPLAIAMALVIGSAETVGDIASHSVTPRLVPTESLLTANGRLQSTELFANLLVGPAVAGLIAATSHSASLVIVGVLYLAAGIAATLLPPLRPVSTFGRTTRLLSGFWFLMKSPRLRLLALSVGLLNLAYALFQSGLPLKVLGTSNGALMLGISWALSGLVCVLLGAVVDRIIGHLGSRNTILVAVAMLAIGFALASVAEANWVVAAGTALTGGLVLINVATVAYRQTVVPDEMLGQVTAAYRLVAFSPLPLGSLIAGLSVARMGIDAVLFLAVFPAIAAAALFILAYRRQHTA